MSKFKTVSFEGAAHRIFTGQLRVCGSDQQKNYKLELMLLNEKTNENKWRYTHVAEHAREAENIPLLYSVINGKVGNSHDFEVLYDEQGNRYASFIGAESEHPYGWLPDTINGQPNARMANIDGTEWLTATAYLPSFYNPEMIRELEKNGGRMPISIETLVSKNHMDGDVEVEDEYSIIGVTILGVTTKPAVVGANIRKLALAEGQLNEMKLRVASLANADSNTEPQNSKTKKIQKEGATKIMKVKDLQEANVFPNFTVLSVAEKNVALLSDKGTYFLSTAEQNGNDILVGAKVEVYPNAMFENGDVKMSVPVDSIFTTLSERCNELTEQLEQKTKECQTVMNTLADMQEKEKARRKEAVKTAIKGRLAQFNENRPDEEKLDEHACDSLLADADADKYTNLVDADGNFCGDKVACKDVDTLCVDKQNAIQKEKAEQAEQARANAKKMHVWELPDFKDKQKGASGILGAIERLQNHE